MTGRSWIEPPSGTTTVDKPVPKCKSQASTCSVALRVAKLSSLKATASRTNKRNTAGPRFPARFAATNCSLPYQRLALAWEDTALNHSVTDTKGILFYLPTSAYRIGMNGTVLDLDSGRGEVVLGSRRTLPSPDRTPPLPTARSVTTRPVRWSESDHDCLLPRSNSYCTSYAKPVSET